MLKLSVLKSVACALFVLVALNCSETKIDALPNELPIKIGNMRVVDGVLHFANQEEFDKILTSLRNKDSKILNEWENQFSDFVSMRKAYGGITESDKKRIGESMSLKGYDNFMTIVEINGEKEASQIIASDAEATLYNKDGIVIIEKSAFKYKFDKVIKVTNATKGDIVALTDFNPKITQSKVSEYPLERRINGQIMVVL